MLKGLPVVLGLSATLCFAGLAQAAPGSGNQWQNSFQSQQSQSIFGNQWQNGQGTMQNNVQYQQSQSSGLGQNAKSSPRVFVNGKNVNFDVAPTIENDRTLVPMRAILEALGLEVCWDEDTQTVTATKGDVEVKLAVGGQAYVNGKLVNLDVPAKIISGRTMVPVRFMSEAMGWHVGWDGDTQTITIIDGEEVTSEDSDELFAPEDLEATAASDSQIKLTWDAVSDADSYYVYRSTTSSGSYSKIGTATSTSYKDTGLSSETEYYYKLKAVNISGASDYSDVANATTESADASDTDELSAPEDLEATAVSDSQITLTWDEVSDADSYYVYRSTTSSGSYYKIGTATSTSYKDTGLSSETTYYYVVKAVNSSGAGVASSVADATTESSNDELSVPEDLEATAVSDSQIRLTWDAVSDADYYYVYRLTSSSGSYSKIDTVTTTSYEDNDLSSETKYYYKVKAVNSSVSSGYSSITYATTE